MSGRTVLAWIVTLRSAGSLGLGKVMPLTRGSLTFAATQAAKHLAAHLLPSRIETGVGPCGDVPISCPSNQGINECGAAIR